MSILFWAEVDIMMGLLPETSTAIWLRCSGGLPRAGCENARAEKANFSDSYKIITKVLHFSALSLASSQHTKTSQLFDELPKSYIIITEKLQNNSG